MLCWLGLDLTSVCKHYTLLPSILQGSKQRIWVERRSTLLWCGSSNISSSSNSSSNNNTSSSEWLTMTGVREVSKQWRIVLLGLRCVLMCRVTTFPFLQSWLVVVLDLTTGKKLKKECKYKSWTIVGSGVSSITSNALLLRLLLRQSIQFCFEKQWF